VAACGSPAPLPDCDQVDAVLRDQFFQDDCRSVIYFGGEAE
jgi:hypothetical protein